MPENMPPEIILPETLIIGHSVEQKPIEAFFFGENKRDFLTAVSPNQPQIETLFFGAIHGDEPQSADLLYRWMTALKNDSFPFDEFPVLIIPVLNPDGLAAKTRVNKNGVDLNRNYPTQNWNGDGSQTLYFQGKQPASEPETQAMLTLIAHCKPKKIISLHTPYRVVNYDGPAKALAETYAKHCQYPVEESIGYPTPGSFGTYFGIERQIPVLTVELPEDEPMDAIWEDNQEALMAMISAHRTD
ncbi:MAG: M14 family murein peptide amidase A [Cyanobacteria bacterium P01_H01_bin.74]